MTPSFDIVPGDPTSTVILHVPHSSREIPADVRAGIVLDDDALTAELEAMTDAQTDVIASRAASVAAVRPWIFVNRLSRLVVDPERFPDQREEMNAVGMGAVYTRTSGGDVLRQAGVDEISGLVDRYFGPYSDAFADLVDQRLAAAGEVAILDVHSFPLEPLPYELHDDGPRPEVCLGTDDHHTPDELAGAAREAFGEFWHEDDTPFAGCYVPLRHYGSDLRVSGLMIEMRRDVAAEQPHALAAGLAGLVDDWPHRVRTITTCTGMVPGFDVTAFEEEQQ